MIVLVLGGTRSGKSEVAERIARELPQPVTYVATGWAEPDPELAALRSERLRRRLAELGVARVGHDLAVRPEPVAAAAPGDRSAEKAR